MEADFAALQIADQTSHQMAPACAQAHHVGSQSTPPLNGGTGAQEPRLAEHQGQRRNSTPAALIPYQTDTFTDAGSLSIDPGAEQPRRYSSSRIHHVMQQWKQENPRDEPFNSVAYYARQTSAGNKPSAM